MTFNECPGGYFFRIMGGGGDQRPTLMKDRDANVIMSRGKSITNYDVQGDASPL